MKQYTVRDNMAAASSNEVVLHQRHDDSVPATDIQALWEFGQTQINSLSKDAQRLLSHQREKHRLVIMANEAIKNREHSEINNSLVLKNAENEILQREIAGLQVLTVSQDTQLKDIQVRSQLADRKLKNSNCCCWFWFVIAVVVLLFVVFVVLVTCYTEHHNDKWRSLTSEMLPHLTMKFKTEFDEKIKQLHTNQSFTMVCPRPMISMILDLKTAWDGDEL